MAAAVIGCGESTAPDRIAAVAVSATAPSLLVGPGGGQATQLQAVATTSGGRARPGVTFIWGSSNAGVAGVTAGGLVTAVAPGTATISATIGTVVGSTLVTVLPVPVATLTLSRDTLDLASSPLANDIHVLVAELRDSTGAVLTGRSVTWTTTAPAVASVSASGVVEAVGGGATFVIASSGLRADSTLVRVTRTTTLPADADIAIVDAHWTQGVQDDGGSIPMILAGRAVVLNALLTATRSISAPSTLVLRLLDGGGQVVRADTARVIVPAGVVPSMAAPTVQFLVPNTALRPGYSWQLVRDPTGELPDSSVTNDRFPRGTPTVLPVVEVPPLRIRFVPIVLSAHGNVTGLASPATLPEYLRVVRALHPHGEIEATIGTPLVSAQSFGSGTTGGSSTFWIGLLGEIDAARVADPAFADAHWVGLVAPPGGFNFVTFGGFGYIPANGASSGPGTRTTALVHVGWFFRESATRELVAHELGHNFGRRHAPCGGAGGPDPAYPRADGTIGSFAHDVIAWQEGRATSAPSIPVSFGDVMGYCTPVWASTYTYQGILDFRGTAVPVALRAGGRGGVGTARVMRRTLLVRGQARAAASGGLELEPAMELEMPSAAPNAATSAATSAAGDHTVEGLSTDGRVLFRQPFSLATLDHDASVRPFAVAVPLDASSLESLASITVRGPAGQARLERSRGAALIRDGTPTVATSGGGSEVRCPTSTVSIAVRDAATGAVLGTARGAALRLPSGPMRSIRVSCSDGVRTATRLVGMP